MVKIVTDSTADIPAAMVEELGITVVPTYIVFGREMYRDGVDMTKDQFYARLAAGREMPTTATPSLGEFEAIYRRLAAESREIVSIQIIGNLSAVYGTARLAAESVAQATGARIAVIDSGLATMGYGWLVVMAAEAAQRGASMDEIVSLVQGAIPRARVLAVLDNLEFIHRGGRVNWAQAMIGTLLRIKPIIEIAGGEVNLVERARTMERALERLINQVRALGSLERAIVLHAAAPALAEKLAARLQGVYPSWKPVIDQAGVTIAVHAGPGAVGIACVAAG